LQGKRATTIPPGSVSSGLESSSRIAAFRCRSGVGPKKLCRIANECLLEFLHRTFDLFRVSLRRICGQECGSYAQEPISFCPGRCSRITRQLGYSVLALRTAISISDVALFARDFLSVAA
jgi:hypothetical protein